MSRTSVELVRLAATTSDGVADSDRAVPQVRFSDRGLRLSGEQILQGSGGNDQTSLSKAKSAFIIFSVSSMVFMGSLLRGILTVGLPHIARDIGLQNNLLLWPASVYALTCGCTLLLSGSLTDLVGCRTMYLAGGFLLTAFTLGCGLAETGIQLIMFRALSGIAVSLCLPSSTSMITSAFAVGRQRNIAFACFGAAAPTGFSLGLVLAGALIQAVGWRPCYYIVTAMVGISFVASFWSLPRDGSQREPLTPTRFLRSIDWLGALMASTSLALLSYVLAVVTASASALHTPANVTMLVITVLLIPAFVLWIRRQERHNNPSLIPPSLFKSTANSPNRARIFATTCLGVFLISSSFTAFSYFATLFFQEVQDLSPLSTSPRFLPMVLAGIATNVSTGMLVHRVNANKLVIIAAALSTLAPLLMALTHPEWTYWSATFAAMILSPIAMDTIFTIANLIITDIFPREMHGLAGGVFNTVTQIGMAVGLAVSAAVAGEVTKTREIDGQSHGAALLEGYRASFWASLAASTAVVAVVAWGLRGSGKVGMKRD